MSFSMRMMPVRLCLGNNALCPAKVKENFYILNLYSIIRAPQAWICKLTTIKFCNTLMEFCKE